MGQRTLQPLLLSSTQVLCILATMIVLVATLNFMHPVHRTDQRALIEELKKEIYRLNQDLQPLPDSQRKASAEAEIKPAYQIKANSINSFWWPSLESGLLAKLASYQNPLHCSSSDTKFFVWRSLPKSHDDTRGLSAWGHTATWQLMHALTDGDQFEKVGSRVLIQDEELWPMAKGCQHGPETRDCYFQPLSKCKLADADPMDSKNNSVYVLKTHNDDYDRSVRTLYSAQSPWWRTVKDTYSWTGLLGGQKANSEIAMLAALFAYFFNPQPWLQSEIHERLQKSIPADLDPDKTIGVPIRRSDKCHDHSIEGSAAGEMKCLPLTEYLKGVQNFLAFDPTIQNIIITSEDKAACDEFVEMVKTEMPGLRIILNIGDVQQGTGSGSKLENYAEGATNAAVVASALTSMHLHLRARFFVITSQSTWTSTLTLMARFYGFSTSEIFVIDLGDKVNRLAELAKTGCYK